MLVELWAISQTGLVTDLSATFWEKAGYGSGWALVAVFVWLIYTGRLVPRKTYEDKEHEANEWRAEARIKDQAILGLNEMNTAMLREFGPTVTDLLHGIRKAADETSREG